ncbi:MULTISPECIES: beta-phosphoglucomutase family hydrolase [unclassified Nocardia]|uniref:beta-phosphoglucomutase family hydrolase n=1 Tax=unclassified Nocardia TaxID=2637762 RepID=UPI001CE47EEF|nr:MULTISPECIES: beta-phosphoglucomutase family hydrolase [unclassified Nocardia]
MYDSARPAASGPRGTRPPYDAVLFDMDGVVTDTANIHAAAWKQLFDSVLPRIETTTPPRPFGGDDYSRLIDGKARIDGVTAFLKSRGITLPPGAADDPDDALTVAGLADRKNTIFLEMLARQPVHVFPGTVDLVRRLRRGRVRTALVTASKNARAILRSAGLSEDFDTVVDGTVAEELGLPGKPDPAMYLEAAHRLGVPPGRTVVVEDAPSGVRAGANGGFGLVVGVDRVHHPDVLTAAGADIVVHDVSELDLGVLLTDPWVLGYGGYDPAHEGQREALTALCNGYLGTRGAAPEFRCDDAHYPGTYLAGVYNRCTGSAGGRVIEDEHMVNAPDWLPFDVRVGNGWLSEGLLTVRDERRDLDLRTGVLTRSAVLVEPLGRALRLTQRRLVSMARPHLAALETTLQAHGWSGQVEIRSGVNGGVTNANVPEYQAFSHCHLTRITGEAVDPATLLVQAETSSSRIRIALAARTRVRGQPGILPRLETLGVAQYFHRFPIRLRDGYPVVVDKIVAIVTSRDTAIASPALGAAAELARAPRDFEALLPEHRAAWRQLWDQFGIELDGADTRTRLVFDLHLFHLAQTITRHTADLDAGVPARGLHGEGYRGHVFWDELFVLPVLTLYLPEVAKAVLRYRSRRLPAARFAAAGAGLAGALFPWQSGSDGREETPARLFNPRSGHWIADNSARQRHVGLAVAYNAWQFYECTGDLDWLAEYGAELIVEVARLFTALASYDPIEDRYHIAGVMGPDEYHDGYPDTPGSGVRDNAYTNVLTAWVCGKAVETLDLLNGHGRETLCARLGIDDPQEYAAWQGLSARMAVPFHDGVISQFDGYADLAEFDWPAYRQRYGNIGRLDLILEAEGDSTNRYKLCKQADVLMLIYLLGPGKLLAVLDRLGYPGDRATLDRTLDYYLARCADGSTLSEVVHASVLARMRPDAAWSVFQQALVADLDDTQGGTTAHGIHLGAMAGTIDIVIRSFAGLRCHGDRLTFDPRLPRELTGVRFGLHYRGQRIDIALDHHRLRLTSRHGAPVADIEIDVAGAKATLGAGQMREFDLRPPDGGYPLPAE